MINILILGCGNVARRALPWLTSCHRARVFALVRDSHEAVVLQEMGVRTVAGDLDQRQNLKRLKGLADIVLYCAPPASDGPDDDEPRLRRVMAVLGAQTLRAFIYISTTGVYGDCAGEWVTEVRPLRAGNPRAKRRVAAERIVRDGAKRLKMRCAILRAPGIYAADRLPLARLQQRQAVLRHEDDVFTNHIHADDLARVLCLAAFRAQAGGRTYNVCDDTQMKMGDYFDLVADTFGFARPPRVSRADCEQTLPAVTMSFMSESRRLSNARLKQELRCSLRYAQVFQGLIKPR